MNGDFLIVYAAIFSLASVDWIMALEPMWFSTMWGVYNFAGMILATLAVPRNDPFLVESLDYHAS